VPLGRARTGLAGERSAREVLARLKARLKVFEPMDWFKAKKYRKT